MENATSTACLGCGAGIPNRVGIARTNGPCAFCGGEWEWVPEDSLGGVSPEERSKAALFHEAWGKAAAGIYDKELWMKLQKVLGL